jgi:hypothetical protein
MREEVSGGETCVVTANVYHFLVQAAVQEFTKPGGYGEVLQTRLKEVDSKAKVNKRKMLDLKLDICRPTVYKPPTFGLTLF